MLIDWFTVAAQALNFVILVWLLKHFLYQPVLDAIDVREASIARHIANAQAVQRDAQEQSETYRSKIERIDHDRAEMLAQASSEADLERHRLIEAARQAADELAARRNEALRQEALQLNDALRERASREVCAIARKALTDLASTDLEGLMVKAFVGKLQGLDRATRSSMLTALEAARGVAMIRSAFPLSPAQQASVQTAAVECLGEPVELRFESEADLVSGLELVVGGYKISWNIGAYLDSLEDLVGKLVAPQAEVMAADATPSVSQQDVSAT